MNAVLTLLKAVPMVVASSKTFLALIEIAIRIFYDYKQAKANAQPLPWANVDDYIQAVADQLKPETKERFGVQFIIRAVPHLLKCLEILHEGKQHMKSRNV